MDILKTLQSLNACHGPSGDEAEVASLLEKLAMPFVDECRRDTMGNLIAHQEGGWVTGPVCSPYGLHRLHRHLY